MGGGGGVGGGGGGGGGGGVGVMNLIVKNQSTLLFHGGRK